MSAIVNDRDVLLAGSRVRFSPPMDRAVLLGASANSFRIAAGGGGSPAAITLSAVVLNMTGNVDWAATPATALTITGNQAVLKLADMPADSVVITASMMRDGVTYEAKQTIFKTYDGSQGLPGTSTGIVQAYKRAASAPTDNPGAVTFTFSQGRITTPGSDALANGWTKSIPAGTDPLYVCVCSASGTADNDTIAASEWAAPVLFAQSGSNGINAATVFLYRRTATNAAPAKPGAPVTYTFATGVAAGMDGGWTQNVPADTGGGYLWVTTATAAANTATDTIAASEWAAVQLMARNGSDGDGGQRGTVDVVVQANYWPDDTGMANSLFYLSGYTSGPYNRDRMTLTNGGTFSETRFYDYDTVNRTGSWKRIAAWINGNMVVNGTLSADILRGGTLTGVVVSLGPKGEFKVDGNGLVSSVNTLLSVATVGNLYDGYRPALTVGSSSAQPALQISGGSGNAIDVMSGANGIVQKGGGPNYLFTTSPSTDNAYSLGTSSFRWTAVYAMTGTITSSDARNKVDISPAELGLHFINALRPVSYRLKVGHNAVNTYEIEGADEDGKPHEPYVEVVPRPGLRRHFGLIAQEVRQALLEHGVDDAAFWTLSDSDDENSQQALRYEELISPMIRAIQELSTRLESLEHEHKQLKGA